MAGGLLLIHLSHSHMLFFHPTSHSLFSEGQLQDIKILPGKFWNFSITDLDKYFSFVIMLLSVEMDRTTLSHA